MAYKYRTHPPTHPGGQMSMYPNHAVVIDLQHPDTPVLECKAPLETACHAVFDCTCETWGGYEVNDGVPSHAARDGRHEGHLDLNVCSLNDWYENTEEHTEGIVRIPVEVEHSGDYVLFLPQSAELLGGEGQ